MSNLKVNNIQVGQSATPTQNFVISTPATPDGTMTIARGVIGGSQTQVVKVNADGGVHLGRPAFSAYATTNTSVPSGTFTKIALVTEEFDLTSAYDAPNSRFTPTVAGYYLVTGAIDYGSLSTGSQQFAVIMKNGAVFKRGQSIMDAGARASVAAMVLLNGTTDYVELGGYVTGSATTISYGAAQDSYFQAVLVEAL